MARAAPFSGFEWQIAWRYLLARRKDGGVSVMSIISLLGVALAVWALIAVMSVRSGYREAYVETVLGAYPHSSILSAGVVDEFGIFTRKLYDFDEMTARVRAVPGVVQASPVIAGQVLASANGFNSGAQVFGMRLDDFKSIPLISEPEDAQGDINDLANGVSIGAGLARQLRLGIGDTITLISPDGLQTVAGTSPRVNGYPVVHIFKVGRADFDGGRIYLPFEEAQLFFNSEGAADRIEVFVDDPQNIATYAAPLSLAAGETFYSWSWQDSFGGVLRALQMEDTVMFILMSVLVVVATLNITSGLIMLVKNKGRDVGILRTMGLSEGSVLRVFFICGASIGVVGTIIGVVLGCLFALNIDAIFDFVNGILGGGVWSAEKYQLSRLPAKLEMGDILTAVALSLGLSFTITYFPARRAARLNPVEALRYE